MQLGWFFFQHWDHNSDTSILLLMNHETRRVDTLRVKTLGEPGVLSHAEPILCASPKKEENEKLATLSS